MHSPFPPPPPSPPGPPYGLPPGHYGAYPPPFTQPTFPPPPLAPKNPAMGSANASLGFGIASLLLCCAPIGIVGGIFGFRATSIAKKSGIALSALSLIANVTLGIAMWIDARDRDERSAAAQDYVKGKLDGDSLDPKVACALAERALLRGAYKGQTVFDKVSCSGPYSGDAKTASLASVNTKTGGTPVSFTACYAKGPRWFVSAIVDAGSTCPSALPPLPAAGLSPDALDKAEASFRDALAKSEEKQVGARYLASLGRVRTAVANAPREEKKCTGIDPKLVSGASGGKIQVRGVDAALLANAQDAARWDFVSDDDVRKVLEPKTTDDDRTSAAKSLTEASGPYLLVFSADDERSFPVVLSKSKTFSADYTYKGGSYDGWMFIVDLRSATVLCSAGFEARSSHSVWSNQSARKEDLERKLLSDFKTNFYTQATTAVDTLTEGKMALGYDPR